MWVACRDALPVFLLEYPEFYRSRCISSGQITYPKAERKNLNAIVYMPGIVATVSSN
jgi:hypothetical protein